MTHNVTRRDFLNGAALVIASGLAPADLLRAAIAGNGATRPAVPGLGLPNNTGADLWTIRYVYTFSKRTEFNFGYAHLDNHGNTVSGGAQYAIGGGTSPGLHAPGGNQYAWGGSVRHSF